MAELKTKKTDLSVNTFIDQIADDQKKKDAPPLKLFSKDKSLIMRQIPDALNWHDC